MKTSWEQFAQYFQKHVTHITEIVYPENHIIVEIGYIESEKQKVLCVKNMVQSQKLSIGQLIQYLNNSMLAFKVTFVLEI